jgi:sarcosine reductase
MKMIRQYFDVRDVIWSSETKYSEGVLAINKAEVLQKAEPFMDSVARVDLEVVKPGERARIVHVLDTIQPMCKVSGAGQEYSGFFGQPLTVGEGVTNLFRGLTVMESAPLPWDESASSGLLYPRDAIVDMTGPIAGFTPFSETINLVLTYVLREGKSAAEYDRDIRLIGLTIARELAKLTEGQEPHAAEEFSIDEVNPDLPNAVLAWYCQNQGVYANTLLYGLPIDNLVPTLLHPNELLDGGVVSGNYAWPAFKVPTYLHVNHPIVLELYSQHGKTLNFRGVILGRSHNPTTWHKERAANFACKLARYLDAHGLIMAWEGGGNAAVDGMLTIQAAERLGIKTATITFEFGGEEGTEGVLLVDHVPEADAVISGGSIEKTYTLPAVERVVGGEVLRLNKEAGGYFPPAAESITFKNTTHFYCSGNQAGHSKLFAEAY